MGYPPALGGSTGMPEPSGCDRDRRVRGRPERAGKPRRRGKGAAAAWSILALIAWGGCTVTSKNYRTLSFLFDGVPNPDLPGAPGEPGAVPTFAVVHRPYAEDRCEECHSGRARPSRLDSSACLKCHAESPTEHTHMHGPVAAMACLWCHNPHESSHRHLLRDSDRNVCSQCHTPALLGSERVPAHADPSRSCLECHSGHGGTAAYFLKAGVRDARPAPRRPGESAGP
jgi:predicted CXXCH cytochrome family protein